MNKHIKTLQATGVISDLPKLSFVRIHSVQDIQHNDVSSLPQAQINLVDTATASAARVLLRFTDVTLDEHTDPGVAVSLLSGWIKKLLDGMNEKESGARYKLAMPNNGRVPYMPPGGFRPDAPWQPSMSQRIGGAFGGFAGMRPAWPDARPFGSFQTSYAPSNEPGDYEAYLVAQSLLGDIGATSTCAVPGLSIIYSESKEGPYLRFEGSLGHGVTFGANRVPSENEMAYVSFLDGVKTGGNMAGYFHVGGVKYLYTTGHQHGYHDELRSLLTQAAISKVFNDLWEKHHKAMGLNALPVHFDEL